MPHRGIGIGESRALRGWLVAVEHEAHLPLQQEVSKFNLTVTVLIIVGRRVKKLRVWSPPELPTAAIEFNASDATKSQKMKDKKTAHACARLRAAASQIASSLRPHTTTPRCDVPEHFVAHKS